MAEQAATMLDMLSTGQRIPERRVVLPVRLVERNSVQ
jgi:DNA-binding LacI/PurR family transcriptional regulator